MALRLATLEDMLIVHPKVKKENKYHPTCSFSTAQVLGVRIPGQRQVPHSSRMETTHQTDFSRAKRLPEELVIAGLNPLEFNNTWLLWNTPFLRSLHCTILNYNASHRISLHWTVLHCLVLHCSGLWFPRYLAQHCTSENFILPHITTPQ